MAVLKRAAAELTTGAHLMATRYHYYLRDGFSLCHVRRNTLIARAVLELEPSTRVSCPLRATETDLLRPPTFASTGRGKQQNLPPARLP